MRSIAGDGAFVARPAPEDEQAVAVDAVAACLAGGRRAIVLVPEADAAAGDGVDAPDAFGDRAGALPRRRQAVPVPDAGSRSPPGDTTW